MAVDGGSISVDGQLHGRVVALTGASGGLGLLTVEALLRRGARVIANHQSPSAGLGALVAQYPMALHLLAGDIGEEATAVEIMRAAGEYGRLDAVISNAAITKDQSLVRMSVQDWDEVMRINLRGSFLVTKHALRLMIRQRYGRLIYISSLSAVIGNSGQASYAASKAALHGLSNAVAQEYARYNVRSVVLAPGLMDTGLGAALPEDIKRHLAGRSLLGMGHADSVAATIAFLAGPDADFINGTIIHSDGGVAY